MKALKACHRVRGCPTPDTCSERFLRVFRNPAIMRFSVGNVYRVIEKLDIYL
jgi:hypothetical protein